MYTLAPSHLLQHLPILTFDILQQLLATHNVVTL